MQLTHSVRDGPSDFDIEPLHRQGQSIKMCSIN
jgi:hypothetical protein